MDGDVKFSWGVTIALFIGVVVLILAFGEPDAIEDRMRQYLAETSE